MKKLKFFLFSLGVLSVASLFSQTAFPNDITYVSSTLWTQAKDVQVEGNYAYCAFLNGLLIEYVSDPAHPVFVSKLYFDGGGERVFVKDHYVYLADWSAGLIIIDVSNPANPESIGSYNTPSYARDVFVKDTLAYVADCIDRRHG